MSADVERLTVERDTYLETARFHARKAERYKAALERICDEDWMLDDPAPWIARAALDGDGVEP